MVRIALNEGTNQIKAYKNTEIELPRFGDCDNKRVILITALSRQPWNLLFFASMEATWCKVTKSDRIEHSPNQYFHNFASRTVYTVGDCIFHIQVGVNKFAGTITISYNNC